uniref:Uncharacterized protein LOC108045385 n=1 Tax=Drosophila rhopaloa TaxID=1041015 RepID=A0A6P4EQ32_DRORH
MSQAQSITPIPSTPPPSRRANRPPRINIHNLTGGSAMSQASMPPSAQPPHTAQTNFTGNGTQGPYWPPMANPFGYGNFMTKGYEGFLDITKSGMSFGEKLTFGMYRWSRRWFTHLFLLFILALYSVGGALLFQTIEGQVLLPHETWNYGSSRDSRGNSSTTCLLKIEFDSQVLRIMNNHTAAVESLLRNGLAEKAKPWSFWDSMVYSCTIYTTIGEWTSKVPSG